MLFLLRMEIVGSTISFLLSFIILFQVGLNSMIFIDFKLNQESIAEAHCINKDKPQMNCDGKCYLKTQLEKTKEEKKPLQSPRYFETEWVVYTSNVFSPDFTISIDENIFNHVYISPVSELHADIPEVPPQIFS